MNIQANHNFMLKKPEGNGNYIIPIIIIAKFSNH